MTTTKPGSCTKPLPGVVPDIVTKDGQSLPANAGGLLVMRQPWPAMLRTLYGEDVFQRDQRLLFCRRRRDPR